LWIFCTNLRMNQVSLQQNAITFCDERRGLVSISDYKGPVVCPKPRRVGILANSPIRPLRWPVRYAVFLLFSSLLISASGVRLSGCFATLEDFNDCFEWQSSSRNVWFKSWGRASGHYSHEGKLVLSFLFGR